MPPPAEIEQRRLFRLRETELLDSPAEAVFDDVVAVASKICRTPVAFVSLIDEHRQWFKSAHGLELKETPREYSFCTHVVEGKDVMVVEDAEKDPRFAANPLVTGEMGIRFYAGVPLEIEDGVVLGTLAVVDRTARTLSEEQLTILKLLARQVITEIRLRLQIRAYEQSVSQRMEGIGTLAGGIAHDLNNLLSPIVIGVELLRKFTSDSRADPVIENIEQSARRGKELVQQVLSFARGVEGARVAIEISRVLREVESIAVNTFSKNIQFEVVVADGVWMIRGDPTQLSQVLLNLCVNARDAMPDGGRLSIAVHNREIDEQYASQDPDVTAGRYVLIEVSDQGVGMSKEVLDQAFDPFFTTKEVGQGTGLGLPTALGIIRSHGGFVNIQSEVGKGTTVKIHLPAVAEAPPTG